MLFAPQCRRQRAQGFFARHRATPGAAQQAVDDEAVFFDHFAKMPLLVVEQNGAARVVDQKQKFGQGVHRANRIGGPSGRQ
jgi:hypothetical protein